MTKEKLVRQAAKCFPSKVTTVIEEKAFIEGFVRGAEWMQDRMIEKAVGWLSNNMFHSINNGVQINGTCISDFIERFKKAMQDESRRLD